MTPQETEQFAALRMHVAHLHNALKEARFWMREATDAEPARALVDAALEQSEPAVKDLLTEADRDAQLVATRQQLAETTARLAKIEAAGQAVVATLDWSIDDPGRPAGGSTLQDVQQTIRSLGEALD